MWKKTDKDDMIRKILFFMVFLNLILMAGIGGRLYWFCRSARIEAECRGYGIDVETLKGWEELEEKGIQDLAGWRIRERVMIWGESTKRSQSAQVLEVYGNMELALPADILAGTYGLTGREDVCVMTGELADALFGGVDVVGEQVWYLEEDTAKGQGKQTQSRMGTQKRSLTVAGVIDQKGQRLLVCAQAGDMEWVAVRFQERFQIKERLRELLSLSSSLRLNYCVFCTRLFFCHRPVRYQI